MEQTQYRFQTIQTTTCLGEIIMAILVLSSHQFRLNRDRGSVASG